MPTYVLLHLLKYLNGNVGQIVEKNRFKHIFCRSHQGTCPSVLKSFANTLSVLCQRNIRVPESCWLFMIFHYKWKNNSIEKKNFPETNNMQEITFKWRIDPTTPQRSAKQPCPLSLLVFFVKIQKCTKGKEENKDLWNTFWVGKTQVLSMKHLALSH